MRLARALHAYGTPSHRLESTLASVSKALNLEAQYLVTPTSIIAAVGPESSSRMFLNRVEPGGTHLEKLANLNDVMRRLVAGDIGAEEALAKVDAITEAAERYPALLSMLAQATASGAAAPLFGGGVPELLLSTAIGALIGGVALLTHVRPRLASVFPALAALLAAAVPIYLSQWIAVFPFIPTLAALIVLIPGLSLTIAINELSHQHLVSGTARLTGALVTFLQIGLGVAVGSKLASGLLTSVPEPTPPAPLSNLWLLVALTLTAGALTVLFRARPRDLGPIWVAALAAYWSARFGSHWFGPEIGAALGAFLVGGLSNVLARGRRVPAAITLLPGLLLLVPGSVGFRSLHAMLQKDLLSGIETGFTMVLVAVSLVTGLFLANLVLPSRRLL